jgi:hypothetical protein
LVGAATGATALPIAWLGTGKMDTTPEAMADEADAMGAVREVMGATTEEMAEVAAALVAEATPETTPVLLATPVAIEVVDMVVLAAVEL